MTIISRSPSSRTRASRARRGSLIEIAVALVACAASCNVGPPAIRLGLRHALPQGTGHSARPPVPVVTAFVMVGAGNAVNLTDGLDGLAIVPVMIAAATFGFISYLVRQRDLRELPADPPCAGRRRARRDLRRGDRRRARLPLVQCAAGADLHGRHRLARPRRPARHCRGRDQARDRARHRRRPFRARSALGDHPGLRPSSAPASASS
jgi:hypothetical protein